MPKDLDEAVVEHGFRAAVGGLSFGMRRESDQGAFDIAAETDLQIDYLAEFAEVVVQNGYVVQSPRDLLHFQAAVGRIETSGRSSTKPAVIEMAFFNGAAILKKSEQNVKQCHTPKSISAIIFIQRPIRHLFLSFSVCQPHLEDWSAR